jgi:hypothetical protein
MATRGIIETFRRSSICLALHSLAILLQQLAGVCPVLPFLVGLLLVQRTTATTYSPLEPVVNNVHLQKAFLRTKPGFTCFFKSPNFAQKTNTVAENPQKYEKHRGSQTPLKQKQDCHSLTLCTSESSLVLKPVFTEQRYRTHAKTAQNCFQHVPPCMT